MPTSPFRALAPAQAPPQHWAAIVEYGIIPKPFDVPGPGHYTPKHSAVERAVGDIVPKAGREIEVVGTSLKGREITGPGSYDARLTCSGREHDMADLNGAELMPSAPFHSLSLARASPFEWASSQPFPSVYLPDYSEQPGPCSYEPTYEAIGWAVPRLSRRKRPGKDSSPSQKTYLKQGMPPEARAPRSSCGSDTSSIAGDSPSTRQKPLASSPSRTSSSKASRAAGMARSTTSACLLPALSQAQKLLEAQPTPELATTAITSPWHAEVRRQARRFAEERQSERQLATRQAEAERHAESRVRAAQQATVTAKRVLESRARTASLLAQLHGEAPSRKLATRQEVALPLTAAQRPLFLESVLRHDRIALEARAATGAAATAMAEAQGVAAELKAGRPVLARRVAAAHTDACGSPSQRVSLSRTDRSSAHQRRRLSLEATSMPRSSSLDEVRRQLRWP